VRVLEFLASTLGSVVTVSMTIWLARFTLRTIAYGELSESSFTPLWIPRLVLTFGMGVLAFQMLARLVTCMVGDPVNRPGLGVKAVIE